MTDSKNIVKVVPPTITSSTAKRLLVFGKKATSQRLIAPLPHLSAAFLRHGRVTFFHASEQLLAAEVALALGNKGYSFVAKVFFATQEAFAEWSRVFRDFARNMRSSAEVFGRPSQASHYKPQVI